MMNAMAMPANQGITNRAASDRSVPKDLIELLRLAKLQRDQQAAARAQALNAPQTPTVKEQLEEATGIAAMAQGGMVPGYAEGGEIENEITKLLKRRTRGDVDGTISSYFSSARGQIPEGSPAYRQKEKEVKEEVYRDKVDNKFDDLLDPNTPQSDESFSYYKKLKSDFDKGVTAPEEILKIISSGKPPEVKPKGAEKSGSGEKDNSNKKGNSNDAVDKILKGVAEGKIDPNAPVSPTDMDSLIQSILNPKDGPEDNIFEPESQSKLQTLADFLIGGAGTSNIGTTFANAAGNMSAEADKDEAKQIAANKDARADTFARKSLVLNSELKSSQIEATRILAQNQMDATSVAVIQKNSDLIQAKINEISEEVIGSNLELQELMKDPDKVKEANQLQAVLQQQIDGQTAGYRKSLQENQTYLNKLVGIAPPTNESSGLSRSRANSLLGK